MRALFKISILVLVAAAWGSIGFSVQAASVWKEPACGPTGCNAEAPINTSAEDQAKLGGLSIGQNFAVSGIAKFLGNVGIGTTNPTTKLEVLGGIKTDTFRLTTGAGAGKVLYSDPDGWAYWSAPTAGGSYWGLVNGELYNTAGDRLTMKGNVTVAPPLGGPAIYFNDGGTKWNLALGSIVGGKRFYISDLINKRDVLTISSTASGSVTTVNGDLCLSSGKCLSQSGGGYWTLSGTDLKNNAGTRTTIQGNLYVNGNLSDLGAAAQVNGLTTNSIKLNGVTRSTWPLANCRKVTATYNTGDAWKAVACNAGEIAVSGGGFCGGGSDRLAASEPLMPGAGQTSDAYIDGNLWGWAIKCIASQGNYQRDVFAICCGL